MITPDKILTKIREEGKRKGGKRKLNFYLRVFGKRETSLPCS